MPPKPKARPITGWNVAYWVLLAAWLLGAALGMGRINGGFLTSYLADLAFPPWYYIVVRGLASGRERVPPFLRWFGRSPERAALSIFLVGLATEVSQRYWPQGLFAGTFDPWDIAAYGVGLMICYAFDRFEAAHRESSQG